MTLGVRERYVAGGGLLVLASSFLPWWTIRVRVGTEYRSYDGSAWLMSSRWSAAILITVAAAAIWLTGRVTKRDVPWPVHLLALSACALSIFLAVAQWRDIEAWPRHGHAPDRH
jgi:hypothetical protein